MKNILKMSETCPKFGYANHANAVRALAKAMARTGAPDSTRYVIAATPFGRFVPVVTGAEEDHRVWNLAFGPETVVITN